MTGDKSLICLLAAGLVIGCSLAAPPLAWADEPAAGETKPSKQVIKGQSLADIMRAASLSEARSGTGGPTQGPSSLANVIADLQWRKVTVRKIYGRSETRLQTWEHPRLAVADADAE